MPYVRGGFSPSEEKTQNSSSPFCMSYTAIRVPPATLMFRKAKSPQTLTEENMSRESSWDNSPGLGER